MGLKVGGRTSGIMEAFWSLVGGREGLGRWRGRGKGGELEIGGREGKDEGGVLCFDAGIRGGKDVREGDLFGDGPEGGRSCQGGVGGEEEGEGLDVHLGERERESGKLTDA